MDSIKQYVFDFVEGRVSATDFIRETDEDPSILEWVQSVVPSNWTVRRVVPKNTELPVQKPDYIEIPYEIHEVMEAIRCGRRKTSLGYQLNLHSTISEIMKQAFPEEKLIEDESLHKLHLLLLDVCPDYIGGSEVDESGILERIIDSIPKYLSKPEGEKWAKEEIKKCFHIEGRQYPHWIQEPEWPMYNGKPMKYMRTERRNKEAQEHVFIDFETGIEQKVFDAH